MPQRSKVAATVSAMSRGSDGIARYAAAEEAFGGAAAIETDGEPDADLVSRRVGMALAQACLRQRAHRHAQRDGGLQPLGGLLCAEQLEVAREARGVPVHAPYSTAGG